MRVLSSFGNELTKKALKAMFEGGNQYLFKGKSASSMVHFMTGELLLRADPGVFTWAQGLCYQLLCGSQPAESLTQVI